MLKNCFKKSATKPKKKGLAGGWHGGARYNPGYGG